MFNFQSGVLEKTRLVSNLLIVVLLAGNLYFTVQYVQNLNQPEAVDTTDQQVSRIKTASFLKLFINTVLKSDGTVSFDDRVQLENDIRQLRKPPLTRQWELFVNSKNSKDAQVAATELMLLLAEEIKN